MFVVLSSLPHYFIHTHALIHIYTHSHLTHGPFALVKGLLNSSRRSKQGMLRVGQNHIFVRCIHRDFDREVTNYTYCHTWCTFTVLATLGMLCESKLLSYPLPDCVHISRCACSTFVGQRVQVSLSRTY